MRDTRNRIKAQTYQDVFMRRLVSCNFRRANQTKDRMEIYVCDQHEYHVDDIGFFYYNNGSRVEGRSWDNTTTHHIPGEPT
jgi:hypothetical protein